MYLKVLLIGSGITSALISTLLKQKYNSLQLVVWDKARGVGGRMSTSRSSSNNACLADLGAQYITVLPENLVNHKKIYDSLIKVGVLETLTGNIEGMKSFPRGTIHYVAPNGMNSIVKHFLNVHETKFGRYVTAIKKVDNKILVETKTGIKEMFDVVILTQPVPQLFELTDLVEDLLTSNPELKQKLMSVKYSSRYALGIFYDKNVTLNVPWTVRYIYDDDILRYIGLDDRKRNLTDVASSIVLHTTVTFGENNINEPIETVQEQLVKHVKKIYPSWPEAASFKCQKWQYSQVMEPYVGQPGCVILLEHPLLIAGGDGFTESNFNGCISSAKQVAEIVAKHIDKII